jgi:hypothetical protein
MPAGVARRRELAFSPQVVGEVLAAVEARANEWMGWEAFRQVIDKHRIGFCLGHVLSSLARTGRIRERNVYVGKGIGAERPGSPNYYGFKCEWRAIAASPDTHKNS